MLHNHCHDEPLAPAELSASSESESSVAPDGFSSSDVDKMLNVEASASSAYRSKRSRNAMSRREAYIQPKKDAPWQRMLDMNAKGGNTIHDEASTDGRYFRRRFRMPFQLFQCLIAEMLSDKWFVGYGPNGEGRLGAIKLESNRGASLQVMVLSCLRILGRGLGFDEVYDGSGCKEECIRIFFHKFCPMFVAKLMPSVVRPPLSVDEISEQVEIYQR